MNESQKKDDTTRQDFKMKISNDNFQDNKDFIIFFKTKNSTTFAKLLKQPK